MTSPEGTNYRPLLIAVFARPREAIERILVSKSRHLVLPLATAGGSTLFVGRFLNTGLVFNLVNWRALLFVAIAGAVVGIASLYLTPLVFCWVGRFIDGCASSSELRSAWAWSTLPSIFGFLVVLMILLISRSFDPGSLIAPVGLLLPMKIITGVSRAWAWVVFLVMISQVHRFTIWWAIITCVAGMASIIVIAILVRTALGYLLNIPPDLFDIREYVLLWLP
jgi:hypothetical protein